MNASRTGTRNRPSGNQGSKGEAPGARFLAVEGFERLLELLVARGYLLIGPTVRDDVIVYGEINGVEDLPRGVREIQGPGTYRLEQTGDDALFAWAHGPDSAKRFLFPPRDPRQVTDRDEHGRLTIERVPLPEVNYAFVGLRPCDLHAIEIQDRVFLLAGASYRARREDALVISVNCGHPGATCFCASMHTGPRSTSGFDIALTEIDEGFTAEAGTQRGVELLAALNTLDAGYEQVSAALRVTRVAERQMQRTLDTNDLPDLLYRNREHPQWDDVGARCLTCTNCTMVCPTCFCYDFVDTVSLDGNTARRSREWSSCFTEEFSHMASGSVRSSAASRYRQWLTHKFAAWIDQFELSGCVGCGRCITWCPVGIDVTEEIKAIRSSDGGVEMEEVR